MEQRAVFNLTSVSAILGTGARKKAKQGKCIFTSWSEPRDPSWSRRWTRDSNPKSLTSFAERDRGKCYLGAFGNAFTTVFSTLGALGPYRPSSARARVVLLLWFHVANSGDGCVVGRAQARARCTA